MADDWRKAHPRLAWALARMEDGEFKDGLVSTADKGRMSKRQMAHLGHLANRMERKARGESVDPPAKGTRKEFAIVITKSEWGDNSFGDRVYRVDFLCLDGWRGRWETTNELLVQKIEQRPQAQAKLTAAVKWHKGDYGILGGRVQLVFA
jgi:hypothetical protein